MAKFPFARHWNISDLLHRMKSILLNLQKSIRQFTFDPFCYRDLHIR